MGKTGNGAVPGRRNGRSKGREAGKPLSPARRKVVGGFLPGPDCDPDTLQASPGWLC